MGEEHWFLRLVVWVSVLCLLAWLVWQPTYDIGIGWWIAGCYGVGLLVACVVGKSNGEPTALGRLAGYFSGALLLLPGTLLLGAAPFFALTSRPWAAGIMAAVGLAAYLFFDSLSSADPD